MKCKLFDNYGFGITLFLAFVILPVRELEGLFCHQCLAMECGGESEVCESARVFITKELRKFYLIGKYLESCPAPDDLVQWRDRETKAEECEARNEREATCSLGRIRVTTEIENKPSETVITHATILGCAHINLLLALKPYVDLNKCNEEGSNGTLSSYNHYFEVEHCPMASDYCTFDNCIDPSQSVVKSYKAQTKDSSFEYGAIIGIVIGIIVIFLVVIAASLCKSPLNRSTNYSPTQVQANSNLSNSSSGNTSSTTTPT